MTTCGDCTNAYICCSENDEILYLSPIYNECPEFVEFQPKQESFGFTLNFEDAAGNKDQLILGYDEEATIGIDPEFGEKISCGRLTILLMRVPEI